MLLLASSDHWLFEELRKLSKPAGLWEIIIYTRTKVLAIERRDKTQSHQYLMLSLVDAGHKEETEEGHGSPNVRKRVLQLARHPQ